MCSDLTRAVTTGSGAMANSDAWAKGAADYLGSRGITSGEIQDSLTGKPPSDEEYPAKCFAVAMTPLSWRPRTYAVPMTATR